MAATDLISDAEARTAMRLGDDTTLNDALARLVESVSSLIDDRFGCMVLRPVDETVTACGSLITLASWPLATVDTVTENGNVLDASQWHLHPDGDLQRLAGGYPALWSTKPGGVRIEGTSGRYADTAAVPARVKSAAIFTLRHQARSELYGSGAVEDYEVPATAVPTTFALPMAAIDMLTDLYEVPGIA